MELKLIFEGKATLEDLYRLHKLGYEFIVADGSVTHVYR
jgi:hypothetical protein